MKKSKLAELDNEQLERVISMAQEERKPFEVIKEEFGLTENEVTELRGGKVYFTSTDQLGDFRIGTGLVINRVDGTITGRTFNKALFAVMTPYILAIEG